MGWDPGLSSLDVCTSANFHELTTNSRRMCDNIESGTVAADVVAAPGSVGCGFTKFALLFFSRQMCFIGNHATLELKQP